MVFFGRKKVRLLEHETKKGFSAVKKDLEGVGQWIKHLEGKDKQLFENVDGLKEDLSSIKEDLENIRETLAYLNMAVESKQVSKKTPVYEEQTAVEDVYKAVQTGVQTGNISDFLHGLSSNERLLVYTLLNTQEDMKLSYEDLALLLGKERSTVRGQVNAIKQKSEGLIKEMVEPSGKKRVYIDQELKEKMAKSAKVRVKEGKKYRKLPRYVE